MYRIKKQQVMGEVYYTACSIDNQGRFQGMYQFYNKKQTYQTKGYVIDDLFYGVSITQALYDNLSLIFTTSKKQDIHHGVLIEFYI